MTTEKSTHWSEVVKQAEAEGYARGLAQGRREGAEENRSRVLQLEELVDQAALWFEEYAQLHLSKGTDQGRVKAKRNERRARTMRKGLLTTPDDAREGEG